MLRTVLTCAVSGIVVLSSLAVACSQWNTGRTNRLVEEANRFFQTGAALHNEARPKFNTLFESIRSSTSNRAKMESEARELAELYTRGAAEYRKAADKIAEAAEQAIDDDVKAYFDAKSRRWKKSAEIRDMLREYVLLIIDQNVGVDEFSKRQAALDAAIAVLNRQEKGLEEDAEKIYNEHRKKFD
jgi:hypothetical protein